MSRVLPNSGRPDAADSEASSPRNSSTGYPPFALPGQIPGQVMSREECGAAVAAAEPVGTPRSVGGTRRSSTRTSKLEQRVFEGQPPGLGSSASVTVEQKNASLMPPLVPADAENQQFLTNVMKKHFLFSTLPQADYVGMFSHLRSWELTEHDIVFQQGDIGDRCYFIRSGTLAVSIDGNLVRHLGLGDSFGELALLYHEKRSATITCTSKRAAVWLMDHAHFKLCMDSLESRQAGKKLDFYRADPNFQSLPALDLQILACMCSKEQYEDGDCIVDDMSEAEDIFIVTSGTVVISFDPSYGSEEAKRGPGWTVGCYGLFYGRHVERRVRAVGDVVCVVLKQSSLKNISKPVEDVLRRCAIKSLLSVLPIGTDLFQYFSTEQLHRVIAVAEEASFDNRELVFASGDPGQLIVVVEGEIAVLRGPACEVVDCSPGTVLEDMAEFVLRGGMSYGDEEFRRGKAMSSYGVALGRVRVHRIVYDAAVQQLGESVESLLRHCEIKRVLCNIFLFKNLGAGHIDQVVRRLEQQEFAAGDTIVEQGETALDFYLIQSGTVQVKKDQAMIRTLGRWDYFGERGLLLQNSKRSATCKAMEACTCLVLDANTFFQVVGLFRKELERRIYLQDLDITLQDLRCLAIVGRGAFGIVRLVCHKADDRKQYALKAVKKKHVKRNHLEESMVMERDVNAQCYHPCIVQFIKTFQDERYVYLLTEFLGGGDLFLAIRAIGMLTKDQSHFFSGSIVLAIEYLHARCIIYRDLKPENVLLDFAGRAKLVDFGCCKKCTRTSTLVGTLEYMAPEVIMGTDYSKTCDWWSLGVMLYEFVVGPLPFGADAENQEALLREILHSDLQFPGYVEDSTARSVLSQLLEKQPHRRLGGGVRQAKDVMEHPYFVGFGWDALAGGFLRAPWRPEADAIRAEWEPPDEGALGCGAPASKDQPGMEWAHDF